MRLKCEDGITRSFFWSCVHGLRDDLRSVMCEECGEPMGNMVQATVRDVCRAHVCKRNFVSIPGPCEVQTLTITKSKDSFPEASVKFIIPSPLANVSIEDVQELVVKFSSTIRKHFAGR